VVQYGDMSEQINLDEAVSGTFHQIYNHHLGWDDHYLNDWADTAAQAVAVEGEWLPMALVKAEILRRAADEMVIEQMASARRHGVSWRQIAKCVGRHHSSVQRWAITHGVEDRARQMREADRAWTMRGIFRSREDAQADATANGWTIPPLVGAQLWTNAATRPDGSTMRLHFHWSYNPTADRWGGDNYWWESV